MGAWDIGPLDNDGALDWLIELEGSDDYHLFHATFERIRRPSTSPQDALECEQAIAAAEVLADQAGFGNGHLPDGDGAAKWIASMPPPDRDLLHEARHVLRLILEGSELKDLWKQNAECYPKWVAMVEDLRKRLGRVVGEVSSDT